MAERTKTYFIADLHLGASYIADEHAEERIVADFFDKISEDASHLYMLGDVLDYWFEYRTVVPRGYVRFLGALARLADRGVKVHWMIGNHDIWLFDYLRNEIGMDVVDGSLIVDISGHRFLLNHGDGVGNPPFLFKTIRSIFRNKMCQWMYAAIHPRWTVGFAHAWSKHSRMSHSVEEQNLAEDRCTQSMIEFSREYLEKVDSGIEYFIYGHRHLLVEEQISDNSKMIILDDWLSSKCYAVFDGKKLSIEHFDKRNL